MLHLKKDTLSLERKIIIIIIIYLVVNNKYLLRIHDQSFFLPFPLVLLCFTDILIHWHDMEQKAKNEREEREEETDKQRCINMNIFHQHEWVLVPVPFSHSLSH